jgi:Domain of unknown function (DUF4173)
MDRAQHSDQKRARRILAAGLSLGLLTEVLWFGAAYGINVPIVVIAVLAIGWLVRRPRRALDPLDAWLPVAAIVLAGLVALRGDPFLAVLDTLGAFACCAASLAAMSGLAVTRRSASVIAMIGAWVVEGALGGAPRAIRDSEPTRGDALRGAPAWALPVGRGLFIGIPLAMIFAVLFASADPIFARTAADILGARIDLGDLPGRVIFAFAAAWLGAGLVSVAAVGIPAVERASLGAAASVRPVVRPRSVGLPEALAILLTVDLVVGLFVGLQVAYLFGGLDTLAAVGMTYADYARRGFFELVAAACLAAAVVVILEAMVERRSRAYLAALLALVALTAVVLVSAALRLRLYQEAYGWTELRLYVMAAIVTMGVGLVAMAGLVTVDRSRWLGHALVAIGLVSLVGLNVLAPAAIVAERNVARVVDPTLVPFDGHTGLDHEYLAVLPDDAVPVLVSALPSLPPLERAELLHILQGRRIELAMDTGSKGWASWNLGRERARAALATLP